MIMRPAWRHRTTPRRRWTGIALTFALVGGLGLLMLWLVTALLRAVDAPGWLVTAPVWLPTFGALAWALGRPQPAVATEDGDDSWMLMAVRAVMVGLDEPRARPVRAITAVVFGAPTAWGLLIVLVLMLVGIA